MGGQFQVDAINAVKSLMEMAHIVLANKVLEPQLKKLYK